MKKFISQSEEQTRKMGEELVARLNESDVVALYGELGSGKTQFIKGICCSLGVNDVVNSPTFVIVNEYISAAGKKIFHFDFYRMKSKEEILDIGFEDYFSKGLMLIEWPELVQDILPSDTRKVFLSHHGDDPSLRLIETED